MAHLFSAVARAFANLALPPICAGCEKDMEPEDDLPLCLVCRHAFIMSAESVCQRCAAPAPRASITSAGCLHCDSTPFHFQHIAALGVYGGLLQTFILRMKHLTGEPLALAAGKLLACHLKQQQWPEPVDLVTAAPMHWTRRLTRGASSAAILAEAVAGELRMPLALDLVRSLRFVQRQATLTPTRRRHNLRGVFAASPAFDIRDAHILIIDDVLTTGTTANALARQLKKAGAKTISVGVVARGIGER